jgi:ribonuclease HII
MATWGRVLASITSQSLALAKHIGYKTKTHTQRERKYSLIKTHNHTHKRYHKVHKTMKKVTKKQDKRG